MKKQNWAWGAQKLWVHYHKPQRTSYNHRKKISHVDLLYRFRQARKFDAVIINWWVFSEKGLTVKSGNFKLYVDYHSRVW